MKNLLYLITALLCINFSVLAQEKKTLYQFEAYGLINDNDAVFKSGVGFTAGAYWPLSPSFNLGGAASVDFTGIRATNTNYTPVSARLAVIWFPEKLFNKIIQTPAWELFYFKTGLGYAFNSSPITETGEPNSSSFEIGFMFPAKTKAFSVRYGLVGYGIKKNRDLTLGDNGLLSTFGVSYNLFTHKNKQP